jgi:hypothetical protein
MNYWRPTMLSTIAEIIRDLLIFVGVVAALLIALVVVVSMMPDTLCVNALAGRRQVRRYSAAPRGQCRRHNLGSLPMRSWLRNLTAPTPVSTRRPSST